MFDGLDGTTESNSKLLIQHTLDEKKIINRNILSVSIVQSNDSTEISTDVAADIASDSKSCCAQ